MVRIQGGASAGGSVPTTKLVQIATIQPRNDKTQAPPVQNVYNTHMDKTGGLTIFQVYIIQSNTEVAAKLVNAKVTLEDASTETTGISLDSGVDNWLCLLMDAKSRIIIIAGDNSFFLRDEFRYIPLKCKQFKLEIKMTDAPGTAQTLITQTVWAQEHLYAEA
jgi:hypothetical protein